MALLLHDRVFSFASETIRENKLKSNSMAAGIKCTPAVLFRYELYHDRRFFACGSVHFLTIKRQLEGEHSQALAASLGAD